MYKYATRASGFISSKDVPQFHRNVVLPSMFPNGRSYQHVSQSIAEVHKHGGRSST